jgi:hypothetical protein
MTRRYDPANLDKLQKLPNGKTQKQRQTVTDSSANPPPALAPSI